MAIEGSPNYYGSYIVYGEGPLYVMPHKIIVTAGLTYDKPIQPIVKLNPGHVVQFVNPFDESLFVAELANERILGVQNRFLMHRATFGRLLPYHRRTR